MARQGKNFVLRLGVVYLAVLLIVSTCTIHVSGNRPIGVNLGFMGDNLPSITRIVELLGDLRVGAVRLYDANPEVLYALSNRPHEVIVSVQNDELQAIATSPDAADTWVDNSVVPFYPATKITFIAVGNEVLRRGNIEANGQYLIQSLKNIHGALMNRDLHNAIKVISPLSGEILANMWPPSSGQFGLLDYMSPLLQFLQDTRSTFFINLYPYYAHIADNVAVPFAYAAFQTGEPAFTDAWSDLPYYNLFDSMLDAAFHALVDSGFPDLPLAVGETGWPTAGGSAATIQNAQLFNDNLIRHVYSKGTPRRPDVRTLVFIFALFNENQKPGPDYERYWGLLNADGSPVYPIDLADPNFVTQEAQLMPLPDGAEVAATPAYRSTPDNPMELADCNIVPVTPSAPAVVLDPLPPPAISANGNHPVRNPVDFADPDFVDGPPQVVPVWRVPSDNSDTDGTRTTSPTTSIYSSDYLSSDNNSSDNNPHNNSSDTNPDNNSSDNNPHNNSSDTNPDNNSSDNISTISTISTISSDNSIGNSP